MKEWKGNSNSAHAAIAAKKPGSTNKREQDDFYATDPVALELLLQHNSYWLHNQLCLTKIWKPEEIRDHIGCYIWECACGKGNLAKVLIENNFMVVATDIKDRGFGYPRNVDFLKTGPMGRIILTNPPYSLATEFIEHALEILPEEGLYIALMNITYLAGQKRYQRVYSKGSLREVYVFSKRIECWKNGQKPKDKCGSIANYAWYVFQKGYIGQPTLYWL